MNRPEIQKQVTALACGLLRLPVNERREALWRWIESVMDADPRPFEPLSDQMRGAVLVFLASEAFDAAERIEAGRDPHSGLDEMLPSGPVN
jgi:hypothetical protein